MFTQFQSKKELFTHKQTYQKLIFSAETTNISRVYFSWQMLFKY